MLTLREYLHDVVHTAPYRADPRTVQELLEIPAAVSVVMIPFEGDYPNGRVTIAGVHQGRPIMFWTNTDDPTDYVHHLKGR
jgi:hypothetical protein